MKQENFTTSNKGSRRHTAANRLRTTQALAATKPLTIALDSDTTGCCRDLLKMFSSIQILISKVSKLKNHLTPASDNFASDTTTTKRVPGYLIPGSTSTCQDSGFAPCKILDMMIHVPCWGYPTQVQRNSQLRISNSKIFLSTRCRERVSVPPVCPDISALARRVKAH